jgi:hypothetical protein
MSPKMQVSGAQRHKTERFALDFSGKNAFSDESSPLLSQQFFSLSWRPQHQTCTTLTNRRPTPILLQSAAVIRPGPITEI